MMGWAVGYDTNWQRDIGYGVPAVCDQPGCHAEIDRGLAYVCGGEPYGGDEGCGLFFCDRHLVGGEVVVQCERCAAGRDPFDAKPDVPEWVNWKLNDESWAEWRAENPAVVARLKEGSAVPIWENPDYFPSWPCAGVSHDKERHRICECRWVGYNWAEGQTVEPHCAHHLGGFAQLPPFEIVLKPESAR